jgi:hypothetical protein
MKMMLLPVRELSNGFTNNLLRAYYGRQDPVIGHILSTYAPQASKLIPDVKTHRDMLELEYQCNQELQPMIRQIVEAAFNETLSVLTEWAAEQNFIVTMDSYLESHIPMLYDRNFKAGVDLYVDSILDPFISTLRSWLTPTISENPWLMWYFKWVGNDFLVEPGMDFRVADWMRVRQMSEEYSTPAENRVSENDHDLINEFILRHQASDVRHDAIDFLKSLTGGPVCLTVKNKYANPNCFGFPGNSFGGNSNASASRIDEQTPQPNDPRRS